MFYVILGYDTNTSYVSARNAETHEMVLSSIGITVVPFFGSAVTQTFQNAVWDIVGGPSMVETNSKDEVTGIFVNQFMDLLESAIDAAKVIGAAGKQILQTTLWIYSIADGVVDFMKTIQLNYMYEESFKFARAANVSLD